MGMYDSIHVELIPADADDLLAYTDGLYANAAALKARFPNATLHTISAVGVTPAEWIDCEPGCVWPPTNASALWRRWKNRGVYCNKNTWTMVKDAFWPGENPEFFIADPTGIAHVVAGSVETQYLFAGGYDESTGVDDNPVPTPPNPAPTPVPGPFVPNPIPEPSTHTSEDEVYIFACEGQPTWLVAGGVVVQVPDATDVGALIAAGANLVRVDAALSAELAAKAAA